jgi:UDP-N-acetylglucosamine 2-epimerase
MKRHIAISVAEGRLVRDLLQNSFLDAIIQSGFTVTLITPADRVPAFVQKWQRPELTFSHLYGVDNASAWVTRAMQMRKRIAKRGLKTLLNYWLRLEQKTLFLPRSEYQELFSATHPSLVVTTNATPIQETQVIATARQMGIPTLGVIGSWDRMYKFIHARTDHISVWSDLNRQEAIALEGFTPDQIHITGPSQLDIYFQEGTVWTKSELCARLGLDPNKPIIVFATAGSFVNGYDETHLLTWLLDQIKNGSIAGDPQIICRLHPFSRLEYFLPFEKVANIRLSFMRGYIPTLGYTMSDDEIIEVANILRHANVIVTPGSTMTIEAAIFDTPVIVPTFHLYQPEIAKKYFKSRVFGRHFDRIQKLNLVPIAATPDELLADINRCLQDPTWNKAERAQLVRDYVQFTDGQSTNRLAQLITRLANESTAKP